MKRELNHAPLCFVFITAFFVNLYVVAAPKTEKQPIKSSVNKDKIILPLTPAEGISFNMNSVMFKNDEGETDFPTKIGKLKFKFIDNKIYVDRNLDGKVDKQDSPALQPGQTFKIPITVAGKSVECPIKLMQYDFMKHRYAMFINILMLQTKNDRFDFRLFDANFNGKYGDLGRDKIMVNKGEPNVLSNQISSNGKFYTIKVIDDGKAVELTPYTGPTGILTAEVNNPENKLMQLRLSNRKTKSRIVMKGTKPTAIPQGNYSIQLVQLLLKLKSGNTVVTGFSQAGSPVINVKEGKNVIKIGPPFKLEFTAVKGGNKIKFTSVNLIGVAGEKYNASMYSPKGKSTLTAYVKSGKKAIELCTLEYG